ncbi:hypothetical protein EJB05_54947, partial [Eragrostis curvula]
MPASRYSRHGLSSSSSYNLQKNRQDPLFPSPQHIVVDLQPYDRSHASSPTISPANISDASAKFVLHSRRNFIFPQSFSSAAFDLDGNDHVPAILDIEVYHAVVLQDQRVHLLAYCSELSTSPNVVFSPPLAADHLPVTSKLEAEEDLQQDNVSQNREAEVTNLSVENQG